MEEMGQCVYQGLPVLPVPMQVNCEREDKDKPLEALSFPKELKINEIDFVQDFNRSVAGLPSHSASS